MTALKRLSNGSGTSWSACTTTAVISCKTQCKNSAHSGVKRLWIALSLTDTSRTSAIEANCSKLASGCVSQPKTNVCNKSAPSNLRSRWIQPVSRAKTHARSSMISFKYCSTCVTLVITRLLSRYPLTDLLISCQIEPSFVISLLKLVPMRSSWQVALQCALGLPLDPASPQELHAIFDTLHTSPCRYDVPSPRLAGRGDID